MSNFGQITDSENFNFSPRGVDCAVEFKPKKDKNGNTIKAPKSVASALLHEISHPLYEFDDHKKIISYENLIRSILGLELRTFMDPDHNDIE